MKRIIDKVATNYTAIVAWRLILAYLLLGVLRVIFYLYNADLIGAIESDEMGSLLHGAFTFDTVSMVYTNILWLTLSMLPFPQRTNKIYQRVLFWLYVVTNTLLIIVGNLADTIYFHFASKRFSGDEMIFADNGNNTKLALQFALDNWWMIPLAALLAYFLAKLYAPKAVVEETTAPWTKFYPKAIITLLVVAVFALAGVRGGLSRAVRPLNITNTNDYTTDGNKGFLILSNPFCVLRTLGVEAMTVPDYFEKEEVDEIFSPYHYPSKERAAAATHKGYNVMVFILESFSAENSAYLSPDLYAEGEKGYMPFLDSLLREGVALRKNYANGAQSIAGTPSVIGSLPSFKKPFVLLPQSIGESYQMPEILGDMGYTTAFFCGSERTSMGFKAYATSAGIDNYISREDYEAKYGYNDFNGTWGIWDEEFTLFAGEVLSELPEPFFAAEFTISSHHPFKIPEKYEGILPEGKTKIQRPTAYTDLALRRFFERYKNEDWFKRTIFAFSADHVSSEKMAERTLSFPGTHHIVGGYYTPDGSLRGEVNDVTQQLDYAPTLLGLLGNDKPFFAFGRDIFNTESTRPKWSVNYVGGVMAYNNSGQVVTPETSDELKAFEQQYYQHVIDLSYIVPSTQE